MLRKGVLQLRADKRKSCKITNERKRFQQHMRIVDYCKGRVRATGIKLNITNKDYLLFKSTIYIYKNRKFVYLCPCSSLSSPTLPGAASGVQILWYWVGITMGMQQSSFVYSMYEWNIVFRSSLHIFSQIFELDVLIIPECVERQSKIVLTNILKFGAANLLFKN